MTRVKLGFRDSPENFILVTSPEVRGAWLAEQIQDCVSAGCCFYASPFSENITDSHALNPQSSPLGS